MDEDEEEIDEGKDPRYTHYDKQTCKCQKPADESPGYTWVFTKAGYDQYLHWVDEQSKRDQDSFGMHIFSDWSGNGIVEVMENQVRSSYGLIGVVEDLLLIVLVDSLSTSPRR